jgi:hypothetical protein
MYEYCTSVWVNSFWFEDADIIDQLAILDLTGIDLIECMYGYTEMEALATYFDMDSRLFEIKIQYAPNNFLLQLVCRNDHGQLGIRFCFNDIYFLNMQLFPW